MAPVSQKPTNHSALSPEKPIPGTRDYEWYKFDNPPDYIMDHDSGYPPGPGGTEWESFYRALALTNEGAASRGLPSHDDALKAIDASAATSNGQTQLHKIYVLYVKHHSEGSRPDSATEVLRKLYARLIEREFTSQWNRPEGDAGLPFEGDPNLIIHRDVVYGKVEPSLQAMDAYLVRSEGPTPVLMEFHGGGWRRGSRRHLNLYKGDLIGKILAAGISVVAVDYRLTPEYHFPAQTEDAARAVQFVRFKAKEWNIDPDRISAIGGSAGGHLLTWVALNEDQADHGSEDPVARQSSRLTCFIVQWAPLDLTRVRPVELQRWNPRGPDIANAFCSAFALQPEEYNAPENEERIRAASPVFQLTPDDPPGFLMYGGAPERFDAEKPPPIPQAIHDPHSYWHGVILAKAMKEAGIEYVPHIHASVGKDHPKDTHAVLGFLKKHFRMK